MSYQIISLQISPYSFQEFIRKIINLGKARLSSYVCVANVHMCIEAYDNPSFANVVNSADLVTPDGMPLAKGVSWLYGKHQDRVAGMDLLPDLLREAEENQLKVYFYGGTDEMQDTTKKFTEKYFPNLDAVGFYSPPFRSLTSEEEISIVQQINDSGANFVFVALGCPKQEKWMHAMKGRIHACMIGIGGALPVMVGVQKRAPKWMQDYSLEWFYRFLQEPKRLFRRYAYTNTKFMYLLLKQKFLKK